MHRSGGGKPVDVEVVCRDEAAAGLARAWMEAGAIDGTVRVATPDEVKEHDRWQESF